MSTGDDAHDPSARFAGTSPADSAKGEERNYAPCTIWLRSTPIFSISTSQTSPGFSQGAGCAPSPRPRACR